MSTIGDYQTYLRTPKLMAKINRFRPMIQKYAQANGVDPLLMEAIVFKESRFNPNAYNAGDAAIGSGTYGGLPQFMKATGRQYGLNDSNYKDPEAQLSAMGKFVAKLQRDTHGNVWGIGKRYNGAGSYGTDLNNFYNYLKGHNSGQATSAIPQQPTATPNQPLSQFNMTGVGEATGIPPMPDVPQPTPFTPEEAAKLPDLASLFATQPAVTQPQITPVSIVGFDPRYQFGLMGLDKLSRL